MSYYVYVLKSCVDNSLYIELSSNPEKRLKEHNRGKTKSIKSKRPYKIVMTEICESLQDARKKEKQYKSGFKREALRKRFAHSYN